MTEDIFANWKSQRFILADVNLLEQVGIVTVLTDIAFWAKNWDELDKWCDNHNAKITGMTVEFQTKEDLCLFYLRWA